MHAHQYSSPLCTIFVQAAKTLRVSLWLCKLQRGLKLILELFRDEALLGLIPLGRSIEMNLDRLLRTRDVVPPPEGFPSVRHNLYLHSSKGRIRNVRDSLTVSL